MEVLIYDKRKAVGFLSVERRSSLLYALYLKVFDVSPTQGRWNLLKSGGAKLAFLVSLAMFNKK